MILLLELPMHSHIWGTSEISKCYNIRTNAENKKKTWILFKNITTEI